MSARHSRVLTYSLAIFLLFAPTTEAARRTNVLLAIYTNNVGMLSPVGKRIYAIVSTDGTLTYTEKNSAGMTVHRRMLTSAELSKLRAALNARDLLKLQKFQSTSYEGVQDYHSRVEITVYRVSGPQEIILVDYLPSAGREFPPAARELLCMVDDLRGASYRLTQNCL